MTDILAPTFADPMDFDLERQRLARRRKIAEDLISTEADAPRMMGNFVLNTGPMGGVAAAIARGRGEYDREKIEDQEKLLGANQARVQRQLIAGIPAEQGQAREQAQYLAATQMPSLRNLISAQMAGDERQQIAEQNKIARREDLAIKLSSDAETKKEHREWQEEQNRLNRDNQRFLAGQSTDLRREIAAGLAGKESAADKKVEIEKAAKVGDAKEVLTLADQAALLVPEATGSGAGAAFDKLAGFIGQSTTGADNAAKLAALGGALISKMPKMTGPQSDKDVMLYKQMAGRIGDPEIPRSQKLAALETIREINSRHAGVPYTPTAPAGSPVRVNTPEEAMALPSGTRYIRPDGKIGVRK